jgi:hypothetical protein
MKPILFVAIMLVFILLGGCLPPTDTSGVDPNTPSAITRKQALQTGTPAYTPLTREQFEQATKPIWEHPGYERTRPSTPEARVEALKPKRLRKFRTPQTQSTQTKEAFFQAWAQEKQRLTQAGKSNSYIKKQRTSFKAQFFSTTP